MQEKEWTRAFGRSNSWSTRAGKLQRRNDRAGRKPRRGGARSHPGRSAQAGRPPLLKEPPAPVFCRQASLSFLCLCVQVCVPKTSVDIANLPKLDSSEGPIRRTREGGSEWEPLKILLEGDRSSNKTNTASNKRLRLTTKVGQAHVATGVPLDLGTNTQLSDPRNAAEKPNLEPTDPHRSDR
jgi:hypothetical protein